MILNQELEAKILEFGKDVAVLAPMDLKIALAKILHEACNQYVGITSKRNIVHFTDKPFAIRSSNKSATVTALSIAVRFNKRMRSG